jgi:hypothetical protein
VIHGEGASLAGGHGELGHARILRAGSAHQPDGRGTPGSRRRSGRQLSPSTWSSRSAQRSRSPWRPDRGLDLPPGFPHGAVAASDSPWSRSRYQAGWFQVSTGGRAGVQGDPTLVHPCCNSTHSLISVQAATCAESYLSTNGMIDALAVRSVSWRCCGSGTADDERRNFNGER